jgi:hypothetical protein
VRRSERTRAAHRVPHPPAVRGAAGPGLVDSRHRPDTPQDGEDSPGGETQPRLPAAGRHTSRGITGVLSKTALARHLLKSSCRLAARASAALRNTGWHATHFSSSIAAERCDCTAQHTVVREAGGVCRRTTTGSGELRGRSMLDGFVRVPRSVLTRWLALTGRRPLCAHARLHAHADAQRGGSPND